MTDPTILALDQMISALEAQLQAAKTAKGNVVIGSITTAERTAALAKALAGENPSPELLRLLAKAKPSANAAESAANAAESGAPSPYSDLNAEPLPEQPPGETPPRDVPSATPVNATASAGSIPDRMGAPQAAAFRDPQGAVDYAPPWMATDPIPWASDRPAARVIRDDPRPFNPPISYPASQRPAASPVTRAPVDPGEFLRNCWRLWGGKIAGHVWTMGRRTPWRVKQAMQPEFNRSGHSWQVEVFSWRQPDESEAEFCSRLARNDRAWDNLERRHRPWTPGPGLDESNRHVQEYRKSQAAARGRGW